MGYPADLHVALFAQSLDAAHKLVASHSVGQKCPHGNRLRGSGCLRSEKTFDHFPAENPARREQVRSSSLWKTDDGEACGLK